VVRMDKDLNLESRQDVENKNPQQNYCLIILEILLKVKKSKLHR
jgi:hypothetical protein